ncbi:MAG TPA: nucleotidyltransferase domain-containing protein, partial [Polyangiaceae bacterium]|nr:nucleotidyltransferase domain-containing protein [Polyangiaceae bacterium]
MFDLNERAIFVTLAGSQAHGTARIGSDVDLRGVCIAPLEVRLSLFERFEQSEAPLSGTLWEQVRARIQLHPTAARGLEVRAECVVYELAKFVGLCASANPNALEILFADERDWLFETPAWRRLHTERMQFLTRKVQQTYLGYALAQLKRIRTHRSWLLTPPEKKPNRADFGLPDAGTLTKDDQNRLE